MKRVVTNCKKVWMFKDYAFVHFKPFCVNFVQYFCNILHQSYELSDSINESFICPNDFLSINGISLSTMIFSCPIMFPFCFQITLNIFHILMSGHWFCGWVGCLSFWITHNASCKIWKFLCRIVTQITRFVNWIWYITVRSVFF